MDRGTANLRREAELLTRYSRELQGRDRFPSSVPHPDDLAKLQKERQQLLEWGENLYREVSRLERERRDRDEESNNTTRRLEALEKRNDALVQKCTHLESVIAGSGQLFGGGDLAGDAEVVEMKRTIGTLLF